MMMMLCTRSEVSHFEGVDSNKEESSSVGASDESYEQRRNEGGQNSPGVESLWGCQITAGGWAPKSPNKVTSTFFNSTFASERPQVRTWGRQTCFLPRAPSNLVTPLLTGTGAVSFGGMCWSFGFGVPCLLRHNLKLYSCFRTMFWRSLLT